jgi:hypothetical protein
MDNPATMSAFEHELEWLLVEEVFSVGGEPYFWSDVLVSAELRGALADLISATRRGLAGVERSAPPADAVREAASRFRYQRGLLSAEDLEAWLAHWHLSIADWMAYLGRTVRSEAAEPHGTGELGKAAAVDAICSGFLEREAQRLATDAALAVLDAAPGDRRALVERVVAAAASARAALAEGANVEREIALRALEWTRLDTELLKLADRDAAREAALCVRADGRSLAEVAADCGVPTSRRALYLEEAEEERLTELLGANPGELVGPIERNGGHLLVYVHGRTRPSGSDPEVTRRAQDQVVARASESAVEARVRWP